MRMLNFFKTLKKKYIQQGEKTCLKIFLLACNYWLKKHLLLSPKGVLG